MNYWDDMLPELLAQIFHLCHEETLQGVAAVNIHWSREASTVLNARLYAGLVIVEKPRGGSRMEWTGVHTRGDINHRGIYVRLNAGEELSNVFSGRHNEGFFCLDDFDDEWPSPEDYAAVTFGEGRASDIISYFDEFYGIEDDEKFSDRVRHFLAGTLPATTSCYNCLSTFPEFWLIDNVDATRHELRRVGEIARRLKIDMNFV